MRKEFDRGKQLFWIVRRGPSPWKVLTQKDNLFVRYIDQEVAYEIEETFLLVESEAELDKLIEDTLLRLAQAPSPVS